MLKMSSLEKKLIVVAVGFLIAVGYITYLAISEMAEHGLEGVLTCIWKGGC